MLKSVFIISLIIISFSGFAQTSNTFNIKKSKGLFQDRCKSYRLILKDLPKDVRYGVNIESSKIYFIIPSLEYFNKIFDKNSDGIAIDIIHKSQYKCGTNSNLSKSWPNRGHLLEPRFKKELIKNMVFDQFNNVVVEYGVLPDKFDPDEIECNVLTIQKKSLCNYTSISNIEYTNWDLLEMGLYWDTIPKQRGLAELHAFSKTIDFDIHFEKDKTSFSESDIYPIYDSLELTNYNIIKISIEAYSSVEGAIARNESIQKGRAQSIIDALQTYQTQEIETSIKTEENWVQFAKDITGTKFEYLKKYSKEKIRILLKEDKKLLNSLEPLLENQRKGIITLTLQKRLSVYEDDSEILRNFFQATLSDPNLERAIFLQQIIFDRIRTQKSPDEFVNQLEIPIESRYGPLFNNMILFNLERFNFDLIQTIQEFEDLLTIIPNSSKIRYNLVVLKMMAWTEGSKKQWNRSIIDNLINEIDESEIHQSLILRLRINFNILLIQYLTYEKKYKEKSRYLKDIYAQYKGLSLNDEEIYSLVKFLAFNSEFKIAEDILFSRLKTENVSEDLLFYYIKLTIGDPKRVGSSAYKKILDRAVSINSERYCMLFQSKSLGGVSFQLKENKILKDSYCANCEERTVN